jgi:radical SAM enzyme (TIGR01210 family)
MYPADRAGRDRFVVERRRAARREPDPWRYRSLLVEDERSAEGERVRVATLFLTGRECPWRCVMCDLWQHTTTADTPKGAIAAQVAAARALLDRERVPVGQIKLYNSGSFFDPRAVPEDDYDAVAAHLAGFDRLIVESHPALIGARVDRLLAALASHARSGCAPARLEVAMGLETVHPGALAQLHKHMTVDLFARAAERLAARGVALRVFLLVWPPFVPPDEQDGWLRRSVELAFSCGATVVSLVPTRPGNGALDTLQELGHFHQPRLGDIERSIELLFAGRRQAGRIFVDLWDLQRFAECAECFPRRHARLSALNLEQRVPPPEACEACRPDVGP